jgi:flagellar biogenesis protein FliO
MTEIKQYLDLIEQLLKIFTLVFTLPWGLMRFCQYLYYLKATATTSQYPKY